MEGNVQRYMVILDVENMSWNNFSFSLTRQ